MAQIQINEKQYELLKSIMLKEEEGQMSPKGEEALMALKFGLDKFSTAIKLGFFEIGEHEIDEPVDNPYLDVWKTYLEPAYKILSKDMYHSKLYQDTHGEI